MSGEMSDLGHACRVRVILDGRVIKIPEDIRESATAIRDFLEVVAMHQERTLTRFSIDGMPVNLKSKQYQNGRFGLIQAESTSFFELGRQMIFKARNQVDSVRSLVQSATTQIIINDEDGMESLWKKWLPELKSPMLVIKYLKELCGKRVDELILDGKSLHTHLRRFPEIWQIIEATFNNKSAVEVSDVLEHVYLPWIERLVEYMNLLCQE